MLSGEQLSQLERDLEKGGSVMDARESWENAQTNAGSKAGLSHLLTDVNLTTQSRFPPTLKRQRTVEFYLTDNS